MQSRRVLVLTSEPIAAAFLGMLLELESYEPVFAEPGERPEDALARVRPVFVIILHSALDAARSDLFYVRAARSGAHVVLFGSADATDDVRALSAQRRIPFFEMPVDRDTLIRVIADLARDGARGRALGDRRIARAYDAPDGTLMFADEAGHVWQVYDRRGTERRARAEESPDATYRIFINETGEARRYQPGTRESLEISVDALMRQLAEAMPASSEEI